jgi:hypothetical protein
VRGMQRRANDSVVVSEQSKRGVAVERPESGDADSRLPARTCQALHTPTETNTPASLGTYIDKEEEKA